MKIGIDCRLWSETGVGRYIQNLVIELAKIDTRNEYVLFCLEKDKKSITDQLSSIKGKPLLNPPPLSGRGQALEGEETRSQSNDSEIENWKLKIVTIRWHSVAEQVRFPSVINGENLDLMHFPYFSIPILYRKPYVMTMHDMTISEVSTGRASTLPSPVFKTKRLAYHLIVNQALHKARKIIVPTKAVKVSLIEKLNLPADKIEVTYEGAELKRGKGKALSVKGIRNTLPFTLSSSRYFLYVGNAYPHKNLERLIEAFHRFWSSLNDAKKNEIQMVLVGKEDYFYKRLKSEFKQKLQNVIFTGYISDEELVYLYQHAKAVVVPSLMEGFGLPAVEAMSLGVPLVISDIPVMKEVCGDAALYFDPHDISSIQENLENMISFSLSDLKTIKEKEIKQSEKFSWQKMAEQTLQIYESSNRV